MKIEHTKNELTVIERGHEWEDGTDAWCIVNSPHECSVPNCPGDLNRRKLELFDKMLEALQKWRTAARIYVERYHQTEDDIVDLDEVISEAKALK